MKECKADTHGYLKYSLKVPKGEAVKGEENRGI